MQRATVQAAKGGSMKLERQPRWNHGVIDRRFYMASDVGRRALDNLFPAPWKGTRRLVSLCGVVLAVAYGIGAFIDRMLS